MNPTDIYTPEELDDWILNGNPPIWIFSGESVSKEQRQAWDHAASFRLSTTLGPDWEHSIGS